MKFVMGSAALALALACAAPASATVFITDSGSTAGYTSLASTTITPGVSYSVTAADGYGFSALAFDGNKGSPLTVTAYYDDGTSETKDLTYANGNTTRYITTDTGKLFTSILLNFNPGDSIVNFRNTQVGGLTALPVSDPATPPATSAVPEPATWALMLAGFGLVGMAMRRRNKLVTRFA